MKVKDLIALLEKGNTDADVVIKSSSGLAFDIDVDQLMVASFDDKIKEEPIFNIRIK